MARPVSNILAQLRGGVFDKHVGEELKDLVQRCQESGKAGSMTITLSFAPKGKDNREFEVTPKLAVKKPAAAFTQETGTFYAVRGDLVRDDPDQEKLPLEAAREEREERARSERSAAPGAQRFVG